MADSLAAMPSLARSLDNVASMVDSGGEPRWAQGLRALAQRARSAQDHVAARSVISDVLSLFGGMGSINDLVLQSPEGVLPEQGEFERLRTELFETAREGLEG